MRRRRLLAAVGAGCGLAGCLDGGRDPETPTGRGAGTEVPTETSGTATTGTRRGPDATAVPTGAPVDAETPVPGECEAADPPSPDADAVGGELAGTASPRSYPEKPEPTRSAVRSFVETYEAAYRYNAALVGEVDGVPGGISRLDTWVRDSVVRSGPEGYVVAVWVTLNYGDDGEEPATASPAPTGHYPASATYYATDRFLLRRDGTGEDPPTMPRGRVVECW